MVGRRKWDDPEVLMECDILLGPDGDKAREYVMKKRQKLLKKFHKAFVNLESIERSVQSLVRILSFLKGRKRR